VHLVMLEVGQLIADGLDLGCVFFRNHDRLRRFASQCQRR
jgi:hypothetical protein